MGNSRWYVCRSKPGQAQIALKNLQQQHFQTYYPHETIERARNGRIVCDREPLFPGYILIYFILEASAWRAINGTRGIIRLLSFCPDGSPSPVRKGEIESLQAREKNGELCISEINRLRKGDHVRVKNGRFAEMVGVVDRTRQERIEFLISLLGRQVRVISPLHSLEVVRHYLAA